jgi:hypothetical protein
MTKHISGLFKLVLEMKQKQSFSGAQSASLLGENIAD